MAHWPQSAQATVNPLETSGHPGTITVQCELVSFSAHTTFATTQVASYNDAAANDAIPVSVTWPVTVPSGTTTEPGLSCAVTGSVTGSIANPVTVTNGTLSAIQVASVGS